LNAFSNEEFKSENGPFEISLNSLGKLKGKKYTLADFEAL
jgi:hypothetical protein